MDTTTDTLSPVAVRIDGDLRDRLNKFVAVKGVVGENTNVSEVIRTALAAYLDGFLECAEDEARRSLASP